MKRFHSIEDPELINDMNKSYHHFKLLPSTVSFKLSRTGKSWGLSEKIFERSKIEEDKINRNLRKSNESLKKVLNSALKQNKHLKQEVFDLKFENEINKELLEDTTRVPDSEIDEVNNLINSQFKKTDQSINLLKKQNDKLKSELKEKNNRSKYQALLAKYQTLSTKYRNLAKQSPNGLTNGVKSYVSALIKSNN